MRYWRSCSYPEGVAKFGPWKCADMPLTEKIELQRRIREVEAKLKAIRLSWYKIEDAGNDPQKLYDDEYAKHFRVHPRRGYEIHELIA